MTQARVVALVLQALLTLLVATPTLAQKTSTDVPAYEVGEKWTLDGLTYELVRVEDGDYVFMASGGNEIRLTKYLAISKVVRHGRGVYDISIPPQWPWPLEVGKFTRSRAIVRNAPAGVPPRVQMSGGIVGLQVYSHVVAFEDVATTAGRFKAFKITEDWANEISATHHWRTTVWYAPALRRIVKSESTASGMNFELTKAHARLPVVTSPSQAPVSRVPPTIALLDPKPGTVLRTAETTLKVEVKSENALKSVVVSSLGGHRTFTPEASRKAGTPWTVEIMVSLAEGHNTIRLEAVDEVGGRATETVHLTRESLVAVSFEGPAFARVRIDHDQHTLDAGGKLILHLAPGRYQLEATKEAFIPLRRTLQLTAGRTNAVEKLVLLPAVPPTITVLSPTPGAVVSTPDTKLTVEVKSRYRVTVLRLGRDTDPDVQTFAPKASAKAEAWVLEPVVRLREGDNTFRLEAVDEHGTQAMHTVTIMRRSLVGLDQKPAAATPPAVSPAATIPAPPVDTEPPKVTINYPAVDAKVESDSIVVTGLVTDNVAVDRVHIAVNGVEVVQSRDIGVVGRGHPIRALAAVRPGNNVIEVTVADRAGNVVQVVRTITRVAPAIAAPAPKVATRWAVVIGISEHEHTAIPKLRFAARDAEAVYRFLTTEGGYRRENVQLLTDTSTTKPTLTNIKRALGDILARRAGRDDMVLIYFAGHGAPEVDVGGVEADGLSKYLIPRDADPEALYTTALPMDEIQRIFARVQAERIVMLLDTCYSGTAGGRTFARNVTRASGLNDQFLERLTRSRGRVIITASGPNEVALELASLGHGIFTYYVLEGLRGKADRDSDGIVTVSELYEYVERHVDSAARHAGGRQRPIMKGEIEGTLPLSRSVR